MEAREGFEGKVALVAGGTGGLGRAVSLMLLQAGATVVTTVRSQQEFDLLTADAARAGYARLAGVTVDVTDAEATAAIAAKVANEKGALDILINAVGGYAGGKNVWDEDPATYGRMMALNLQSGFALTRAVLPIMIRRNRGWIVNVASRAAFGNSPGAALYSASKAGALAFFDSLAEETKPYAINVNTVIPSIIDTPANRLAMPSADFSVWPKPEEIADVILFLCSARARVIHGAAVAVYGRT